MRLTDSAWRMRETFTVVKEQIRLYKEWREVIQMGRFYRGKSIYDGNIATWNVVSVDRTKAVAMLFQSLVSPNDQGDCIKVHGLEGDAKYHLYNKQVSIDIPKVSSKTGSEKEDIEAYGDVLEEAGVMLSPKYSFPTFKDNTRVFTDFASRMYFIEKK